MKKQIKDLELWEVDFLVAKAEGFEPFIRHNKCFIKKEGYYDTYYSPTTNPSQAWPIIERERINITYGNEDVYCWIGDAFNDKILVGKTSLEASMIAYVDYKFGDEVEL